MFKNRVFYLGKARINLFISNNENGVCIEYGKGQLYKSFWLSFSKRYSFVLMNDISGFFHIQGLFVAVSLSY